MGPHSSADKSPLSLSLCLEKHWIIIVMLHWQATRQSSWSWYWFCFWDVGANATESLLFSHFFLYLQPVSFFRQPPHPFVSFLAQRGKARIEGRTGMKSHGGFLSAVCATLQDLIGPTNHKSFFCCCFGLLKWEPCLESGSRFLFGPQAKSTFLLILHQRPLKWFAERDNVSVFCFFPLP